jgi:hypothetical protein
MKKVGIFKSLDKFSREEKEFMHKELKEILEYFGYINKNGDC